MRRRIVLALLLLLAPLSLLLAVAIGSVAIDPASLTQVLRGTASGVQHTLVFELRLPRAGSLLQVLLRNPLADPYVIGVSGGAAVAALLALLAGATSNATSAAAFGGALGSMLLVFALSRSGPGGTHRLLLTGVRRQRPAARGGSTRSSGARIFRDTAVAHALGWRAPPRARSAPHT